MRDIKRQFIDKNGIITIMWDLKDQKMDCPSVYIEIPYHSRPSIQASLFHVFLFVIK